MVFLNISRVRNFAKFRCACSLQLIRDESREKPLELEMGWISAATNFKHVLVPKDLVLEADKAALAAVAGQTVPTEGRSAYQLLYSRFSLTGYFFVSVLGAAEEKVMDVVV